MKRFPWFLALAALLAAALPGIAAAEDRVGDVYALGTCPVSGEKLDSMGGPEIVVIDGREVRFCCAGCTKKFKADPATAEKLDAAMIEDQKADYPLTACPISGKELGDGGVTFVAGNRMVKTCCNNCKNLVQKDPKAAIEKLDKAAIEKQGPAYAATTCPVSGEKLGSMGDPAEVVVANHLVKLCCAGCKNKLLADPAKYLGKTAEEKKG